MTSDEWGLAIAIYSAVSILTGVTVGHFLYAERKLPADEATAVGCSAALVSPLVILYGLWRGLVFLVPFLGGGFRSLYRRVRPAKVALPRAKVV